MPPVTVALGMTFELAAYGLLAGLLYKFFPKKPAYIYVSLILAMIGGRIVLGIANIIIYSLQGNTYGMMAFLNGAFINAIPGIIAQIVLVPLIVISLKKSKLIVLP